MKLLHLITLLLVLLDLGLLHAAERHLLYVGRAPKNRSGFRNLRPTIEVYDINNGHRFVKTIPLTAPAGTATVQNIRGICANAQTQRFYVAHYGSYSGTETGWILCFDLRTEQVLWNKRYASAVDRGAITPDGQKIFMPSGEGVTTPYFYVINALTGEEDVSQRVTVAPKTHNTIVSLDGSKVFMSAFGTDIDHNWLHVVDARTNQPIRRIGPCHKVVRPFTINGAASLAFITTNQLLGFQVGDAATGRILHTAKPPVDRFPQPTEDKTYCHGIALTPNEREVWLVDQARSGVHVFDVSGLPNTPPTWLTYIDTNSGGEKKADGTFAYGEEGAYGQPGWMMTTIDGRYMYPETCEILDTVTKREIGQLISPTGLYCHSRFALEVVMGDNNVPLRVGDQFGVGRMLPSTNPPPACSITAPANNSTYAAGATINFTASASDSNGTIAKVEFFRNGSLVHTENFAPYTYAWTNAAAGTYAMTVRATDNNGATTTSTPVNIVINAPSDPFRVTIDFVSSGKIYTTGSAVLGAMQYIDRSYTITTISANLSGGVLLRVANDDKLLTTAKHVVFSVNKPATVFICYDKRATALPAWLSSGWGAATGTLSTTDAAASPMRIFSRSVAAGQVTLGGNRQAPAAGAMTNYIVVIKPAANATSAVLAMEAADIWESTADTDGDGLQDAFELGYGFNPQAIDSNNNGIVDEDELISGGAQSYFEAQLNGVVDPDGEATTDQSLPLNVVQLRGALKGAGKDSVQVIAVIPDALPASIANTAITVDIGGASAVVNLDAKGRGRTVNGGSIKLKAKRGVGLTLQVNLKRGDFAAVWSDEGIVVPPPLTAMMKVLLSIADKTYAADVSVTCSPKGAAAVFKK